MILSPIQHNPVEEHYSWLGSLLERFKKQENIIIKINVEDTYGTLFFLGVLGTENILFSIDAEFSLPESGP